MSMLLPCDTMLMTNLLLVTLTIWKRWIRISCKCLLYFLLFCQVPLHLIHLFFYIVISTNRIGGLIINLQTSS
jgi:hypothetical protein